MITQLANNLYNVVSDINVIINFELYTEIKQHYKYLIDTLDEYKANPDILYRELFEQWCKLDFYRFCRLVNTILQNEEWQKKAVELYPNFPVIYNELCRIYDEIELRNPEIAKDKKLSDSNTENNNCPSELDTPEARAIFAKAVELGLMNRENKWLKGLQLLACFAREMSLKLSLGKGCTSDGVPRISWKPFEQMFNITNGKLRANYSDVQKTGQQPTDHTLIDRIFN